MLSNKTLLDLYNSPASEPQSEKFNFTKTPIEGSADYLGAGFTLAQGFISSHAIAQKADALRAQSEALRLRGELNSDIIKYQAQIAQRRAAETERQLRKKRQIVLGSQVAAMVKNGVDVTSATAQAFLRDTDDEARLEMNIARTNAFREAYGYKISNQDLINDTTYRTLALENEANDTILTSSLTQLNSIAKAYKYSRRDGE